MLTMLKIYFVVATLFNPGTFTAGETHAPVPLKQFDNIAYEITNNHKEDFMKVFKAIGLNDKAIEFYVINPERTILTLQTPKDAGGVYVLIRKMPGYKNIMMEPFSPNKTVSWDQRSVTYLVKGDKLIHILVDGDKTLKTVWEFSNDQVKETLESGDAKASRVWKMHLGSAPAPTTSPAPVLLKQFDNNAYEFTSNFNKDDFMKVFKAIGYDDGVLEDEYVRYPKKSILTLQTPKNAVGVYVLIWNIPGKEDIMRPFMLNKSVNYTSSVLNSTLDSIKGSNIYLVEGDKLIYISILGDQTLKTIWEFSDDQVIETLEFGDAKASRVWKVQKIVNRKTVKKAHI